MSALVADTAAIPTSFPADVIGLPTKGAVIDSVERREKGGAHWRLDGRILSVDPAADPIGFRVLLPAGGGTAARCTLAVAASTGPSPSWGTSA